MGAFAINSDAATPQPHDMRHPTPQVVAYTLAGDPVVQGFPGLEITYQILDYTKMAKLKSFYVANNPSVTVTFDDPDTGAQGTFNAKMEPPQIGGRMTLYFTNVTVKFTHLEPV